MSDQLTRVRSRKAKPKFQSSHLFYCDKFPAKVFYRVEFMDKPKCMCRECLEGAVWAFRRYLKDAVKRERGA